VQTPVQRHLQFALGIPDGACADPLADAALDDRSRRIGAAFHQGTNVIEHLLGEGRRFAFEDAFLVLLGRKQLRLAEVPKVRVGVIALARAVVTTGKQPDDCHIPVVPGQAPPATGVQRIGNDGGLEVLDRLLPNWRLGAALVERVQQLMPSALLSGS
jgi:hypothetical protein